MFLPYILSVIISFGIFMVVEDWSEPKEFGLTAFIIGNLLLASIPVGNLFFCFIFLDKEVYGTKHIAKNLRYIITKLFPVLPLFALGLLYFL